MSVQFQTSSASTATAGQDFELTAGFIVFRPNPNSDWPTATITYTSPTSRTEQFIPDSVQYFPTITVPVLDDSDHEQDEAIELELQDSLTGPASLLAGQSSARAIIVSDDPLPVITVKAVTATISESDGQAEFSAQITRNPWREVKLAFRTIPTTATVGKRNCDSYGGDRSRTTT